VVQADHFGAHSDHFWVASFRREGHVLGQVEMDLVITRSQFWHPQPDRRQCEEEFVRARTQRTQNLTLRREALRRFTIGWIAYRAPG